MSKKVYVRAKKKSRKGKGRGRAKGAKTKLPTRASMRAIVEEIIIERKKTIKQAWIDGVTSGPQFAHHYLKPMMEQVDGKPDASINLNGNFKDDEVAAAQRSLRRKMDTLIRATLARHADSDDSAGEEPDVVADGHRDEEPGTTGDDSDSD